MLPAVLPDDPGVAGCVRAVSQRQMDIRIRRELHCLLKYVGKTDFAGH